VVVVGGHCCCWMMVVVVHGPCPLSWGPGIMDIVILKVTVNVACSVKLYAYHVSGLVVVPFVGHHRHCCSLLVLLLSSLSASIVVTAMEVVDVVVMA